MKMPFVSRGKYDLLKGKYDLLDSEFIKVCKELESSNKALAFENEDMENYIKELEQEIDLLNNIISELEKEIEDKNNKIENFKKVFNVQNIELFNNRESQRQIRKLAEYVVETTKIDKFKLSEYLYQIAMHMGGGYEKNFKIANDKRGEK